MLPVPLDEVYKLVGAAPDQRYVVAALLAAEAGLRIGEVRGAQWTDIKNGKLTIRRAIDIKGNITAPKHHKARVVAKLPRRGIWIITRLDADGSGKPNNKRKKDSNGSFLSYRACSAAIIAMYAKANVTIPANEQGSTRPWHALRHSFGTTLAMANVPVPTIAKLMGHADLRVTMRYVTVDGDQMDAAVTRVFGRR